MGTLSAHLIKIKTAPAYTFINFVSHSLALIEKEVAMADLKWIFEKGSGRGVYNDYHYQQMDTELVISEFKITYTINTYSCCHHSGTT